MLLSPSLESNEVLPQSDPCNLLGLDLHGLTVFCQTLGENAYRAKQLSQWIHFHGKQNFDEMSNLSKRFKSILEHKASVTLPKLLCKEEAHDGTCKWLLQLEDGECIETVFIPEKKRGTLCISSQVGCALRCDFCWTGKQGFRRHLTTAEIVGQLWVAVRALSQANGQHDRAITNVVMMGMGEPLLNLTQLLPALNLMRSDYAYGFSKYRVTVSTAGIIPAMNELRQTQDVALAVSLHAPNNELRDVLVPINKKYPLALLMATCKDYYQEKRRAIMMEYVMLAGVNDSIMHARQLIRLLEGVHAKVNLIPFNPFPKTIYQSSAMDVIHRFAQCLIDADLYATIRKTRGEKIWAACGQLAGKQNIHDVSFDE